MLPHCMLVIVLFSYKCVSKSKSVYFWWSSVYWFVLLWIMLLLSDLGSLCLTQSHRSFPKLASRCSVALGLCLDLWFIFELIFIDGDKCGSQFVFLSVISSCSRTICWEGYIFSIACCLQFCKKSIYMWVNFSTRLSSIFLCGYFDDNTTLSW